MRLFLFLTSWVKFSAAVCEQECPTDSCKLQEAPCSTNTTQSCGFAECDDAEKNAAGDGTLVWCAPRGMSVVVFDSVYDKLNIDPGSTKVGGCGPILYPILGFSYYSFPLDNTCGTTSDSSATDITFRNEIKGQPRTDKVINRGSAFELKVSCTFESHENVTIGGIFPKLKTVEKVDNGKGEFDVEIALYTNDNFTHIQPKDFNITVPGLLFGGVKTVGTPANIIPILQRCWATPTNDKNDTTKFEFIENFVAVPTSGSVIIDPQQFSLESFTWGNPAYDEIFLNCEVFICDTQDDVDNCVRPKPTGTGRRRRSVDATEENLTTIQVGPISI